MCSSDPVTTTRSQSSAWSWRRAGSFKPYPSSIRLVRTINGERTLFIDDSEANVLEARRHGIDAVLFDRSEACFQSIRERLNLA